METTVPVTLWYPDIDAADPDANTEAEIEALVAAFRILALLGCQRRAQNLLEWALVLVQRTVGEEVYLRRWEDARNQRIFFKQIEALLRKTEPWDMKDWRALADIADGLDCLEHSYIIFQHCRSVESLKIIKPDVMLECSQALTQLLEDPAVNLLVFPTDNGDYSPFYQSYLKECADKRAAERLAAIKNKRRLKRQHKRNVKRLRQVALEPQRKTFKTKSRKSNSRKSRKSKTQRKTQRKALSMAQASV